MIRSLRRLWKDTAGTAILEFAVILPVFCLVGFGLIDLQWAVSDSGNLNYVVTESARCMATQSAACANGAQSYAATLATALHLDPAQLTITTASCNPGLSCTVSATYAFKAVGPYGFSITLARTGIASIPGGH